MTENVEADAVGLETFIEREGDALAEAMQRGDKVAELLRFHLLTECQLERMIQAALPRGDRVIEHGRLGFLQKLELVNAFDVLPDGAVRALRNLQLLRERYAHQVEASISVSDIGSVGRTLGPDYTRTKYACGDDVERLVNSTFGMLYGHLIKALYRLEHPAEPTVLDQLADAASED